MKGGMMLVLAGYVLLLWLFGWWGLLAVAIQLGALALAGRRL